MIISGRESRSFRKEMLTHDNFGLRKKCVKLINACLPLRKKSMVKVWHLTSSSGIFQAECICKGTARS